MKNFKTYLAAVILSFAFTTVSASIHTDDKGVIITINNPIKQGARLIKLEVINDNILRVRATSEYCFPQKQSLIILPQADFKDYSVREDGHNITVQTAKVKAVIDSRTGNIAFYDANGKQILSETGDGKVFKSYTVPTDDIGVGTLTPQQRSALSWHATFESTDDEAFYGLGQHQAEEFNYKGKNEELFQYNTKISIPFVISNKNYGLLWDSYSLCRWGNPNEYQQLNHAFTLYDKNGTQGSLTGTYTEKSGKRIVRKEDSLYFEHASVIGNLPKNFKLNGSFVVYEGSLEAPATSNYRFMLYYAGYVKVFIGGKEVVHERWRTAWNPNSYKFTIPLQKGQRTPIRIEWKPDGDVSYCGLRTATPTTEAEQNKISIWSEMSRDMDYYFIAGQNMDEVISGYRTLTGKAQVMPKWAMGFWQSRERYKSSKDIEETLMEFRKRHIPIDNIVQDWNYWKDDQWGSHEFDSKRYPNPQAMLDSVHALHGRFMISVWPKFYCNTKNYKELDAHGWIYHQAIKDSIYDWLGFMGSFYDAYSAGARKMFWR